MSIFLFFSQQQEQQNVLGELQQKQQQENNSTIHMNKLVVIAFTQAFNNRDITALDKLVAVNEIEHNLVHQRLDGMKRYFTYLITTFPDLHITIDHIIAEGNSVAVFTNTTGTAHLQLPFTDGIPIFGERISFKTADLYRIEDNKIIEHWDIVESVKMLQVLGAIKSNELKNHLINSK